MTNFKKQKRLCLSCHVVWFTPLFEAHWHHCSPVMTAMRKKKPRTVKQAAWKQKALEKMKSRIAQQETL